MSLALKAARAGSPTGRYAGPGAAWAGDPGLFDIIKGVGKAALGFVTGGPVGAVAATLPSLMGGGGGRQTSPARGLAPRGALPRPPGARFSTGGTMGGPASMPPSMNGERGCHSGYHLNKSGYWLKSGQYVPPRSRCVKNRRRNSLNPRALDRAIGRLEGAKKIQAKLSSIETGKYTKAGNKKGVC